MADKKKLDDIIRKVRGLLARADHPNTPEGEADLCRAKAEQFMADYRIEESHLIEEGGALSAVVPVARTVPVCPIDNEFRQVYNDLAVSCGYHVGARMVTSHDWDEVGTLYKVLILVGYDSDLRYAEALYQSARVVFADRMEPKPQSGLSDDDNVYRMRSAGMERIRVAKLMGWGEPGTGKGGAARVTSAYKRACRARGEDPVLTGKGVDVKAFREAYATAFITEFYSRLMRARDSVDTGGAELVLANRKDKVDEVFYNLYPQFRPDKVATTDNKPAPKPRPMRWTKADERRAMRMSGAAGQAGRAAGKRAASEVNINQGGTGRLEK